MAPQVVQILGAAAMMSILVTGQSRMSVLADSVADFSDKQGDLGWQYGYYANTPDSQTFTEMDNYQNGVWRDTGHSPAWTEITAITAHPNGQNNYNRWVVRRWTSNYSGYVLITGQLAKADVTGSNLSDGVDGYILVNGRKIFRRYIGPCDGVGISYLLVTYLHTGDYLDFAVSAYKTDFFDNTIFTARISTSRRRRLNLLSRSAR